MDLPTLPEPTPMGVPTVSYQTHAGVENDPADCLSRLGNEIDWKVKDKSEHFESHVCIANFPKI